jgi:hypothetical protein
MHHSCGRTHPHRRFPEQDISVRGDGERLNIPPAGRKILAPSHGEIAALAYSYWEARGKRDGSHLEDWFRAERELRAEG